MLSIGAGWESFRVARVRTRLPNEWRTTNETQSFVRFS